MDPIRKALLNAEKQGYPVLSERTLCLLPRPELALSHFLSQWRLLLSKLDQEIDQHQQLLTKHQGLELASRVRIEAYRKSRIEFKKELSEIFAALPNHEKQSHAFASNAHQSLGLTVPLAQPLIGYPQNLFRDWVWGDVENKHYLEICKNAVIASGLKPKRILVLAAGGGRLALDLHQHFQPEFTVALDNSYFFAECFDRICFQKGLTISEFPAAPKSDQDQAFRHQVSKISQSPQNLHYVLGDLNYLPFQPESFDLIITPWIIDLIPQKIPQLIHNLSTLLVSERGLWVNFGSFQIPPETSPVFRFSQAEVKMLAERANFENLAESFPQIQYLQSPHSAHHRVESLWALSARRNAHPVGKTVRALGTPDWLLDFDRPIPKNEQVAFSEMMHKVPQRVFELIDGQRSLRTVAEFIGREFEMNQDEAESSLVGFLSRWAQDVKTS